MIVYYENGVIVPPDGYVKYIAQKAGLSEEETERLLKEVTLLRLKYGRSGKRRKGER